MLKQLISRHTKLTAIVVAVVIYALIPLFVDSPYYLDLLIIIIVHAVLAMTFIMLLRNGMINLGIAAFWGVGAYASTILVMKFGLSFWLSLPLSAVITGVIAFGLGYILIGSGSTGFGFIILSAVIGMLFSVVVGNISYLGGYNGISNVPPPESINLPFLPEIVFGPNNKVPYFYLALVLLLLIIVVFKALYSSRIGRAWTAIGLNPRLAESIGVNIFRYKMLAFVAASAAVGLIGSFFAHYEGFVTPNTYGMWINIYIQIYAILGGIGYAILGPLVGSGLMTAIPELMRVTTVIAPIITGTLLILLILFLPRGLLDLVDRRREILEKSVRLGKTILSALPFKSRIGKE